MPIVRIEMLEGRDEARKAELARQITRSFSEVLDANAESVWIVFEDVKPSNWATAGELVSNRRKTSKK